MEVVGWIATGLVVVVIGAGVIVGLRSLPDIRRYLKMRQM